VTEATPDLDPQVRRFESERIHASSKVLILAAIGLALWGMGRLLAGSAQPVQLPPLGAILLVIAIVLHVDHLTYRLGRTAVVLIVLGAVINGVGSLLFFLRVDSSAYLSCYGFSFLLSGVGVAMVAVHKERQLTTTVEEYAQGIPYRAQVTVHASFLSLVTAASGLVLYGFGLFATTNSTNRNPYILMCGGAILVAIGIVSHVEHLIPRVGLPAVIAGVVAPILFAVAWIPDALNPANIASRLIAPSVFLGIGALLGALACVLALVKKRSTDS